MRTIEITSEAIAELVRMRPAHEPVTMLNLLRFHEVAQYEDEQLPPCSGRDAYYKRYAPASTEMVKALGGKVIWAGRAVGHTVCPPDERWDDILIVEYPDAAAVATLFHNPAYQAVVKHRRAAVADSRLIPMSAGGIGL